MAKNNNQQSSSTNSQSKPTQQPRQTPTSTPFSKRDGGNARKPNHGLVPPRED